MNIIDTEHKPLDTFCEASDILYDAVAHTLGPNGLNTAIFRNGSYLIINDGKSIIEELTSPEAYLAPALEYLKGASYATNVKAGDGTTSTILLTRELLHGAKKFLEDVPDWNRMKLASTLSRVRDELISNVDNDVSKQITVKDYESVVRVALGSDKYVKLVTDAFKFLDKGQRPNLVKTDTIPGVSLEELDGVVLNKIGIDSMSYLDKDELNNVKVICLYEEIDKWNELLPILNKTIKDKSKLILIHRANGLSPSVCENLLFNYTRGSLDCVPIELKYPNSLDVMKEIADYCGCKVIDGIEIPIQKAHTEDVFGDVEYALLNKHQVLLRNTVALLNDVKSEDEISENVEKALHLPKKSCILRIGGISQSDRTERFMRIEDAVNSLANAIEYGVTPGSGCAYIEAFNCLSTEEMIPHFVEEAMQSVYELVTGEQNIENYVNIKSNIDREQIIDSAKVTTEVIYNAFTTVVQALTCNALIHPMVR